MKPYPSVQYSDYLQIDTLLKLQNRQSEVLKKPAHDEMLFIVVHQAYELWFKQILFDLDSILSLFRQPKVDESYMGTIVHRLERISEIQKLLVEQITVLETMTPLDFLDFRDFLYPASGFQSVQYRLLENKLGLLREQRLPLNSAPYESYLKEHERPTILQAETEPSLFTLVEKWLERTPFLDTGDFKFWDLYKNAVQDMLEQDRDMVRRNSRLTPEEVQKNLDEIAATETSFAAVMDEGMYNEQKKQGQWRLSWKAMQAALLIELYRDQPALHLPFRILSALKNIDELMTTWRYRHALMAQRMLGSKIGTGGSSGHRYLKAATDKHRVFADLFALTTFFIPRSALPPLPESVRKRMSF